MWRNWVFKHIHDRLERLESVPEQAQLEESLRSAQTEIVALRASQDHTQTVVDVLDKRIEDLATSPLSIKRLDALQADLERLTTRMKELTHATAEGIERVERSERRVQNTIQRSRKELAQFGYESAGLEAEAAELRLVDGGGGEESQLPTVRPEVAEPAEESSSLPGVTLAQLRQIRGL